MKSPRPHMIPMRRRGGQPSRNPTPNHFPFRRRHTQSFVTPQALDVALAHPPPLHGAIMPRSGDTRNADASWTTSRVACLTVLPSTSGFAPDSGKVERARPQNAAGRPLGTRLVLHQFLRYHPAMGRAHSFFSHTASSTRFFSRDSASIYLNSLFSRSSSLQPPGLIDLHVPKLLLLPPMEGHLRHVFLPANFLDAFFTTIRLSQNANLVFRRIPFTFHSSGPFLRPRLTHQVARKNRSHRQNSETSKPNPCAIFSKLTRPGFCFMPNS